MFLRVCSLLRLIPVDLPCGGRPSVIRRTDLADSNVQVAEPEVQVTTQQQAQKAKPKRQPRYNVVLWDDSEHTFDYVIRMLQELFGHALDRARAMANTVDSEGKVICLTTTLEHAELKRDQIHAYGRDPLASKCSGSMSATIEPLR